MTIGTAALATTALAAPRLVTLADTTAPVFVGSLTVTALSTSASVLCPTATDDVGVEAYDCSLDGGITWPYTSATTTVSIPGLTQLTAYTVLARARDAAGNASAALSKAFTTPVEPPAVDPAPATVYASYATLQASLARWMHRDDLGDMLPEFIALAEARLNRDIRFRQQLTTIALTTVAGSPSISMPATWLEWKRLRLLEPDRELVFITPAQRIRRRGILELSAPTAYTIEGPSLMLLPTPNAVYTIEATFIARLPTLSATNPTTWLMTAHPSLYLWAVMAEAAVFVRDQALADSALTRYAQDLATAKAADNGARHSGSPLRMRAR